MAWQDRHYHREETHAGGGGMARLRFVSVVAWLLIINIGVFVIDGLLSRFWGRIGIDVGATVLTMPPLTAMGHFSAYLAISGLQIWRFLTFQFLHGDLWHLFFNMLAMYFFGPLVEQHLGSKRFLAFYLICGFAGAACYLLLWGVGLLIGASWVPLVGASAGIFGILVAGAMVAPNMRVMLLIPPIPVTLRTLALVFIGIAMFMVLTAGENAGGQAAHLGGAAMAFMIMRFPGMLRFADRPPTAGLAGLGERLRERRREQRQQRTEAEEAEVDRILAKVKNQGLHSLTAQEKRLLQRATERQRRTG